MTACGPVDDGTENENGNSDQTEQPGGGNTDKPDEPEKPDDKTQSIKFQDENTKLLCTLLWDENEDGEFSYEEAAAVTDLGTAFKGSAIIAFTELKYFTSLKKIAESAFEGCVNLVQITLPEQINSIGINAFSGCTNLKKIAIPDSTTSIDRSAFNECTSLASATIGNNVTSIGDGAFEYCSKLSSVTIPNSVTEIGYNAFFSCSKLSSITIGNSVTSIGAGAFEYCTSLTSITIPDSVTSIGEYAFLECRSLNEVYCKPTTPPTAPVNYLGKWNAFDTCSEYTKIYVPAESAKIYKSATGWSRYASDIVGYDFDNGIIDNDVEINVIIDSPVGITGNPDYEKDYPSDSTMCIYIEANGNELKSIKLYISTNMPAEITPEEALALSGTKDMSDQYLPDIIEYGYTLAVFTGLTPGTTYDIFLGFTTIYGKTQYYRAQYTPTAAKQVIN